MLTLGALLSERTEESILGRVFDQGLHVTHANAGVSAHHMVAASVLLNTDVALGTLRRQKGAIRLTHHQPSSKKNDTKLQ